MSAEIGSTRIVSGYGCARTETMSSNDVGKKRAGICSENLRQQVEKCFRRKFAETTSKKDVLSMFVEDRNVFLLRFVNSYQQRQIWREIYTGYMTCYFKTSYINTFTDLVLQTPVSKYQFESFNQQRTPKTI
ncbi:hypothetical protein MKX03_004576 [Papaver bracteatum]|nr:hypothetical protein MKX03_004576 [Papaver bracteatum]